jgi:STE24 endopeptidase
VAGVGSGLAMLAVVACTPLAMSLESAAFAAARGLSPVAAAAVALVALCAMVVLLWELAAVPALLYLSVRVGRRYGTGESSIEDILGAQAQAALVLFPFVVASAAAVRLAMYASGDWWWLTAALALAAGSVLAVREAPAFLARVAGARPIARESTRRTLEALAARAGVTVFGLHEVPGGGDGPIALVSGLAGSHRVFVSADLLRDWTDDEIGVVVGHELGHCVHRDAWRSMAADAALLAVSFGVAALVVRLAGPTMGLPPETSIGALPALALVSGTVWLLATPLRHAQSRRHERRADAFALALTGGADAFDTAIRRLGARHLAEERPAAMTRWLFHRHPSVGERLEYARAYRDLVG